MPTKVDYPLVSQTVPLCAPGSDHARGWARPSVAQEVSESREILMHAEPLVGAEVAKVLVGSLTPSCSTSVAALPSAALPVLPILASLDHTVALAAPMGDARPSPAEPFTASSTRTVENPTSDTHLVERFGCYQPVTPSSASPPPESTDNQLMHLLGASISSTLGPVKSSIEDILSRLRLVEGRQSWAEMVEENTSMDNLDTQWGAPGDSLDPFHSSAPPVKTEEDDNSYNDAAHQAAYKATFSLPPAEFQESLEGAPISNHEVVHPWFEELTCQAFGISPLVIDLVEGHHITFQHNLVDMWEEFCDCANLRGRDRLIPPLAKHHNIFVDIINHRVQSDHAIAALHDSTTPRP